MEELIEDELPEPDINQKMKGRQEFDVE